MENASGFDDDLRIGTFDTSDGHCFFASPRFNASPTTLPGFKERPGKDMSKRDSYEVCLGGYVK
jgi:hypothetical protein